MIRIGIIGAGYVGCFVGAHLARAGGQVTFLGRERFGKLVQRDGLTIEGDFTLSPEEVHWATTPEDLPELDVAIFTSKSHDTVRAAGEILSRVKKDSLILTFQNGVRNKSLLRDVFPYHRILSGMVPFNIVQVGEGAVFRQATKGQIYLEHIWDERLRPFRGPLFKRVGNIEELQWGKLLRNLNNALNALSDRPLREQLSDKRERKLLSRVVSEGLSAMRKNRMKPRNTSRVPVGFFPKALRLPDFLFNPVLKKEVAADESARLSMWQDLKLKRKTEIDYLNGEIVDLSRKAGIKCPYNERIVDLIKLAEAGKIEEARSQYQKLLDEM